jgi:replicative DNA helicase
MSDIEKTKGEGTGGAAVSEVKAAAEALPYRKKGEVPSAEELLAHINRPLPYSDEAEKGLLSSILHYSAERLSDCRVTLPVNAFYSGVNKIVYKAILDFYDKNIPLDPLTLTQALRDQGLLDKVGGASYIAELYTFAAVPAHYDYYKNVVINKYSLRELIHACSLGINDAYEFGKVDVDDNLSLVIDRAEQRVLGVREVTKKNDGHKGLNEYVVDAINEIQEMIANPGQLRGLSTGYTKLDSLCSGLRGSEMFVIAARPSMGKTSLAMNIVEHIAVDCGYPCAVFSLEMSASQLVRRLLVSRAQLSMQDLTKGLLTKAQQQSIAKTVRELNTAKIFIDDTAGLDIMELRAKARRLHKEYGIKMIMIDYLQLMTSSTRRAKDNRQIEIAEISAGIKGLAKELDLPIIVLAQLNRGVENRKGSRPVLSDLRESGSIEQDADMVGLLTREDYAGAKFEAGDEQMEATKKGSSMLILAKNRNGPTDDVRLRFIDYSMRFIDAPDDGPEQEGSKEG